MIRTIFLVLTAGFLAAGNLGAITVDDAVTLAKSHNLGIQSEDLKLAQKADEKNFSFDRLYPSVSVSTTVMRLNQINLDEWEEVWPALANPIPGTQTVSNGVVSSGTAIPFSAMTSQMTSDYNWMLSLGLNIQLVLNPAVFRGITQTLIDYQTAKISHDAAAAKLSRDVRKAFYQLLALHEATGVFSNQLQVSEERWKLAKLNFDAGLGSEISALQAQVAWENRKPVLADQQVNESNAQSGFKILLNEPDDVALNLEGSLDVAPEVRKALGAIDVETLVKRYMEGRWDLGIAQGTSKSLENIAQLQADSLWPSLVFGFSMDPSVQAPFKSDTWSNPAYSKYNWDQTRGAFSVTLNWKLDGFIPGSTTAVEIAGRQRQAKQAELAVEQTRRAGENEIRNLVGKLKESALSLESQRTALDLADRTARLSEDGYKAGTLSFNDAQDADLAFQTAKLQYLNQELALQSTLADLDYALAADRQGWLHG